MGNIGDDPEEVEFEPLSEPGVAEPDYVPPPVRKPQKQPA